MYLNFLIYLDKIINEWLYFALNIFRIIEWKCFDMFFVIDHSKNEYIFWNASDHTYFVVKSGKVVSIYQMPIVYTILVPDIPKVKICSLKLVFYKWVYNKNWFDGTKFKPPVGFLKNKLSMLEWGLRSEFSLFTCKIWIMLKLQESVLLT